MTPLRARVDAEFEQIERVLEAFPQDRPYADLSALELAGVSTLLHNFYNGIENVLKQVVQTQGLLVPDGPSWHRDLVNLAVSNELILASTSDALKPYLAFRHFFVHAYAIDLEAERLEPLSKNVDNVFARFRRDIEKAL
jgi:uncharacterized protein YutE (UPF0331/DUF86 family)